jgi:molybdopterin converting factor small subunit
VYYQMNVRLKLFATFRRYLPPGSQGNACHIKVPAGTRVADLLARFDLPTDESKVILVNGRDADPERVLEEGDVVGVFPSMAGG